MIVNELRYLIFPNYYRQIRFSKENSYHSIKHQKKKDLHLFATKLNNLQLILQLNKQRKCLVLVILNNIIILI